MATIKQKIAFKEVVNGSTITRAMKVAGYAESTADRTNKLTRTKGFLELCDSIGLTDEFLTSALHDDIKTKKGKREKELRLAFQIRGRIKGDSDPSTTNNILIVGGDQAARIARRTIARLSGSEEVLDRLPDSNEPEVRTELAP